MTKEDTIEQLKWTLPKLYALKPQTGTLKTEWIAVVTDIEYVIEKLQEDINNDAQRSEN
jgi:hypothetical protein